MSEQETKWSRERFDGVAQRSSALHGNRQLLPVAVAVAELESVVFKAPEVVRVLGGEVPSHRVLEALDRLCKIGAITELPYPGRPLPRLFERRESPYWAFAVAYATGLTAAEA